METSLQNGQPARAPLGIYPSRCDDKGRVRLPKEFEDFLRSFPEPEFFITSIDGGSVVRVYPISAWRENEKILEEYQEDPDAAEDIAYLAHYWGGVSTIDAQGRVLVPPDLRRKSGIEDSKVFVRFYNGAAEIYSEAAAQQRLERANGALAANLKALRMKGLK